MFANSLKKTGEAFGIYLEDTLSSGGKRAHGLTTPTEDGTGVVKIQIAKSALSSWTMLASTVGHELNHVYHFVSGAYNRWYNQHNSHEYASARSEYIAYSWEYRNGNALTLDDIDLMNSYYKKFKSF